MDPELANLTSDTWRFIAVSAGLGVVIVAVQQMLQDVLPLRRYFQRREIPAVVHHIADRLSERFRVFDQVTDDQYQFEKVALASHEEGRGVNPDRALGNLIALATGGNKKAFYNLPIDQLAGQISVAAQNVLDYPRHNPDLVLVLSTGAAAADVIEILSPPPPPLPPGTPPSQQHIAFIDARNRVAHQIQRNLDAIQIHMRRRLRRHLQSWSIVLGLAFALLLFWAFVGCPLSDWRRVVRWVATGVLAGLFSALFSSALDALLGRTGAR